jgi:putative transposase
MSEEDCKLMALIDRQYIITPFYGSRRMKVWLRSQGYTVNRKKVTRLMRLMGLQAIYPKPNLSRANQEHKKYPYLLRNMEINRVNQVWSADITYVKLKKGFIYLVAIIDWYSRYVLSWEVSTTLDSDFCVTALNRALERGKPEIFNTDQGVQFTSTKFTERLEEEHIAISMDGRGRALDNVFIERLWRSVKYEEVYLHDYGSVIEAIEGLKKYFTFYNEKRFHQGLGYRVPLEVFRDGEQGIKAKETWEAKGA